MKINPASYLDGKLLQEGKNFPLLGQLELTYRCQFNCVHCYCKGSADKKKELTTAQWRHILDELQEAGCLYLGFTGGDPFARPDFPEIYSYAKKKGFLVTILTNAFALNKKIIGRFAKSPPYSFEITVNGTTPGIFESITRKKGSFSRVMANIRELKKNKLLFYIKSNCLTGNSGEVPGIKKWVDELLGKVRRQRYYFSYDFDIFPGLDGNLSPCRYRLSPEEIVKIASRDADLRREYKEYLRCEFPRSPRSGEYLYHCSSWKKQFFIDPSGRLKFCQFTDKFSADLKKVAFNKGFYEIFPRLLQEKFKTDSKCKSCSGRAICNWCPAKSRLETGSEEAPVPYYCRQTEYTLKHDRSGKT